MPTEIMSGIENAIISYGLADAAIAKMETDYMVLTVQGLDDDAGFQIVHEARMVVKNHRVAVEKKRKDLKAGALEFGRKVDSEAKRITCLLEPIETHLGREEAKVTDEKERIRTQKILDEQERVAGIRAKIQAIRERGEPHFLFGKTSSQIRDIVCVMMDTEIEPENYTGFEGEARKTLTETMTALEDTYEARVKFEKEEADRKAESERLEKVRKEQEAEAERLEGIRLEAEEDARRSREFLEAERRKIEADKAALEAEKAAEAQRKRQAEFEKQALETARVTAERDAIEKVAREAREAKERAEAEALAKVRAEALRPLRDKLLSFADAIATLPLPDVTDPVAGAILEDAIKTLTALARKIRKSAKEL